MPRKIDFAALAWQPLLPGARCKISRDAGQQLRLLELTPDFLEPDWCNKGHVGFVVEGELEIDFQGDRVAYQAGDALSIPAGPANAHKARALSPRALLFLVEEEES